MTDYFPQSVQFVLAREGGYNDIPEDRGGATNFGISQKSYPNEDIRGMTRQRAEAIYRADYWLKGGCDKLAWPLCLVHFDACVNAGIGNARRFLSRSNGRWEMYLELRRSHYERLIAKDPKQEKFRKGWMNRLKHIEAECKKANDGSLS